MSVLKKLGYIGKKAQGYCVYDADGISATLTSQTGGLGGTGSGVYLINENLPKGSGRMTRLDDIFESQPFKYVSLFSGIGGFEQALNKLGGKCVMASEYDPTVKTQWNQIAYEILYGHKPMGDITKINENDVPNHDLLVGGFPCQAFSVAGKRLGFEDTRGTLFFEMARIAKAKKPKVILAENVKGLVGHDKGRTLNIIIQTLCDIGYTVDFNVLNSKYFGVPQNRERVFIVAVRDDLVEQEPWMDVKGNTVVPKGKRRIQQLEGVKTFNFDWPPQEEVTTRLRDILEDNVDEKYYLSEEKTAKLVAQLEERGLKDTDGIDVVGNLKPSNCTRHGQRDDVWSANGVAGTLNATDYKQPRPIAEVRPVLTPERENKRQEGRRFKENDDPAFTLNTQDRHGVAIGQPPKYRIRKLTPRECFRLQGFPDSEFDKLVEAGISNSQLYKMAGNAVTVNVIDALGRRLLSYIN